MPILNAYNFRMMITGQRHSALNPVPRTGPSKVGPEPRYGFKFSRN